MSRHDAVTLSLGVVLSFGLFAAAGLVEGAEEVLLPAAPPLAFFAFGALARVLRPASRVGSALLRVGLLHLAALVGSVGASATSSPTASGVLTVAATVCYTLGFAAVVDLLCRYPTGEFAWAWLRWLVRGAVAVALLASLVGILGSPLLPNPSGLPTGPNPVFVPALQGLLPLLAVGLLLVAAGPLVLLARYTLASPHERRQLRWPLTTTGLAAVAMLTTGVVEQWLGPQLQTATFVTAAVAVPGSFLVGLIRHTDEAERLATVTASRARMAESAARERQRIERDLHDGVQQQLIAILTQVELALADPDLGTDAAAALNRIRTGLVRTHQELRSLARGIYPSVLTDRGLVDAVRSVLVELPVDAELEVDGVAGRRFEATVESAAYFFVLEGLTNALKHAGTDRVAVSMQVNATELAVSVTDPGGGFSPDEVPARGGLRGLADRLAALGGRLELSSRAGRTAVTARLPIRAENG